MSAYSSTCEVILYDTPGMKENDQSTDDKIAEPDYAVLEGPGDDNKSSDQSTSVYATVNDGCVSDEDAYPCCAPPKDAEVSFLEEIYTTLTADRDDEDINIYESLRSENSGNRQCDSWSLEGMQSTDQDYVAVVS